MIGRPAAALVLGLAWGLAATARAATVAPDASSPRDAGTDAAVDASAAPDGAWPDGGAALSDAAALTAVVPAPTALATVRLGGRVLEKGTRNPIGGAAIAVDGRAAAETDGDGRFDLNVPVGDHTIAVQIAGQQIVAHTLTVAADQPTEELTFRVLLPNSGVRYQTTVRATRAEIQQVPVSATEARQAPGTGGDPLRVIGLLPGVLQIAWPASLYVVRGANPGNTGFFLDGIRVPELFHLALPRSVIHPYLIEGVEFYPGGGPANFGPYVSGIMAARTAAPPADRVHASADVTVYDAGAIATAPWDGGRGTVALAARYSYTGALFSALSLDTLLRYGDYQLRVDHPLAGGQATLFAFGSLDDVGWTNPGANAMEYGALQFHRLDLRWRRTLGGGRLLAGATFGIDRANSTLYDSPIKERALSVAPRLTYTRALSARADVEVGASAEAQSFESHVPMFQRKQSDLARSRQALSQAAYATLILRLGRRWVVSPAVRADLFSEQATTQGFIEPRLDVLFQLSDAVALRASGGRFAQMPSLPVSVAGFEAFALADLGAQTSVGGSLGAQARLPGRLSLNVTGYYQRLRVTDVRNIDITNPDPTAADFLVSRQGRAYGIEVLLRRADIGRLFGWVAYTLSWSQRYDDTGVLGRSDWDERHILNVVSGYRIGGATTVGVGFHLNTGRWAPVINSPVGAYQQLPLYYQIDLRAERRFVFDRFVMDLYADFENVTLNPEVLQLESAGTPASPMAVNQEGLKIILPTVGVHAQF
ncbi:MAG TPA: carboxypeptidase regulatory-like domain-containing protein [Polyangia bacterium]|nr:carboxypeptidase regulatory-like domain-containing protein [Polyangia bacterium]